MKIVPKHGYLYIGHGAYEPWISILHEGQEMTWLNFDRPKNIEIIHIHAKVLPRWAQYLDKLHERNRFKKWWISKSQIGMDALFLFPFRSWIPNWKNSNSLQVRDRAIEIQSPDAYLFLKWKDIGIFSHFLKTTSQNYLAITTTSSYINLSALSDLFNRLPQKNVYFGPKPYDNSFFVSGSFRIFSRDVVEKILLNRKIFRGYLLEDAAIGKLLQRVGVKPVYIEPNNLSNLDSVMDFPESKLSDTVHFRLKSGEMRDRKDVELMHLLHNRFVNRTFE